MVCPKCKRHILNLLFQKDMLSCPSKCTYSIVASEALQAAFRLPGAKVTFIDYHRGDGSTDSNKAYLILVDNVMWGLIVDYLGGIVYLSNLKKEYVDVIRKAIFEAWGVSIIYDGNEITKPYIPDLPSQMHN